MMTMISHMTRYTANSIDSLLKLPTHIFMGQYKLLEQQLKKD